MISRRARARPLARTNETKRFTFNVNRDWYDFIGLLGFGLVGIIFKHYGWSRPALLIGFFLSSKVELLSYQTQAVYGLSFLYRPVAIILIVLCLATIFLLIRQRFNTNYDSRSIQNKSKQIYLSLVLICVPLAVIWDVSGIPDFRATLFPIGVCLISISLLILILAVQVVDLRSTVLSDNRFFRFVNTNIYENVSGFNSQFYYYLSILGYLAMNFIFGFPIASVLFINLFILFHDQRDLKISLSISLVLLVFLWTLSSLLTLQFPNGLIGTFIDMPWWLGGKLN